MNAVDTNILVYAHDQEETPRKATALALIDSLEDGVLLWQVACEYLEAQRKSSSKRRVPKSAWEDVDRLVEVWGILYPDFSCLEK